MSLPPRRGEAAHLNKIPMRLRRRTRTRITRDGRERWLLTYSDLITLLLAFFIILYSMANVNQGKFRQMAQSLHVAFGAKTTLHLSSSSGGRGLLQPVSLLHPAPVTSASSASGGKGRSQQISLRPKQAAQVHAMLHEDQVFSRLFAKLQTYILTHHLQTAVTAVIHADVLFCHRIRPIAPDGTAHPDRARPVSRYGAQSRAGRRPYGQLAHSHDSVPEQLVSVRRSRRRRRPVSRREWGGSDALLGTGI